MKQIQILFFAFVSMWNTFCGGFIFSELMHIKSAEDPKHFLSVMVIFKLLIGLCFFIIIYHYVIAKTAFYNFAIFGVIAFVLQATLIISSALSEIKNINSTSHIHPPSQLAMNFTLLCIEGICSYGSSYILGKIHKMEEMRKNNGQQNS